MALQTGSAAALDPLARRRQPLECRLLRPRLHLDGASFALQAAINQESAGKIKQVNHFVGGRDAARAAGVHNPDASGRFAYFVDFDGDGKLDMVFANQVREQSDWVERENDEAPAGVGLAMKNNGDRTFSQLLGFAEYTRTMLLTDADGDGHANELVVQQV